MTSAVRNLVSMSAGSLAAFTSRIVLLSCELLLGPKKILQFLMSCLACESLSVRNGNGNYSCCVAHHCPAQVDPDIFATLCDYSLTRGP